MKNTLSIMLIISFIFLGKPVSAMFDDKEYILVNKTYGLPKDFIPKLVHVNLPSVNDAYLTYDTYLAYINLYQNAAKNGHNFIIYSSYRNYEYQESIYDITNEYVSPPGHSEHQTGLAIDITIHGIGLNKSLGDYPAGIWLKENAYKFGFIIRYPLKKEHITKYPYEPWHIRYVGNIAKIMYLEGLCLEEYIDKYVKKIL